ncbi:MAG: hypothetical protein HY675_07335 [Chloroflexi bacterium]|nr:hypothetical protein [Chloroflexota bacterium]
MSNREFRQSFPAAELSLERATENVPDDGRFHLIVNGVVVKSFRFEKAAQTEYQALRKAYLHEHPIKPSKVDISDVIREDHNRMSNKQLIWGPEDFERLERMTKPRRRR